MYLLFVIENFYPHETIWEGLSPESKEDVDKLNQMLYNEIVDKLGLV